MGPDTEYQSNKFRFKHVVDACWFRNDMRLPQALTTVATEQAAREARMAALMTAKHRTPVIAIAGW